VLQLLLAEEEEEEEEEESAVGQAFEASPDEEGVPPSEAAGAAADTLSPRSPSPEEALFHLIDSDHSGAISLQEFRLLASLLSMSDEALVEETFAKIDTDQSGEVDLEEFKTGLKYLRASCTHARPMHARTHSRTHRGGWLGLGLAVDASSIAAWHGSPCELLLLRTHVPVESVDGLASPAAVRCCRVVS
jgi:hypothetical protein